MAAQKSQDRRKFRPQVEGLESLQLLSGMAHAVAAAPTHAEATRAPAAVTTVHLLGTIHATAQVSSSSIVIAGSGNLGAVGPASIHYRFGRDLPLQFFTISTRKGQIILAGTDPTLLGGNPATVTGPSSGAGSIGYTVDGGTGAYAHATGSGTIAETVKLGKGDGIEVNFKFS